VQALNAQLSARIAALEAELAAAKTTAATAAAVATLPPSAGAESVPPPPPPPAKAAPPPPPPPGGAAKAGGPPPPPGKAMAKGALKAKGAAAPTRPKLEQPAQGPLKPLHWCVAGRRMPIVSVASQCGNQWRAHHM
jgi:hypothetical protein